MKALLIGGTGFLGRHLTPTLQAAGYKTIVLARRNGDITTDALDINAYREVLANVDIILNLVGKRADDERINVELVQKLLKALEENNPNALFVQFGTRLEYGQQEKLPVAETTPCKPDEPYAQQKLRAEQFCEQSRIRTLRLRLTTVYGVGGKGIIYSISNTLQKGETFTIYGTGEQIKDFIHVSDVVKGILLLLDKDATGTYNLGSGEAMRFRDAVEIIRQQIERGEITFDLGCESKDPSFLADTTKLKSLGWKPHLSFQEGIQQLVEGRT